MTTKTKMGSLHKIAEIARDVLWKARNSSIDCDYTYEEFIASVKQLDDDKGNPPIDVEHQNPAPPIVETLVPIDRHPTNLETALDEGYDATHAGNLTSDENKEKAVELREHSMSKLKQMCKDRDEKMSGSKKDLVARLLQKRKPEILITRIRQKQYIPKLPSCNAAILVAILLHNETGSEMMKKEAIMNFAEETGISKDPMFGNGKSWYNGELFVYLTATVFHYTFLFK